MMSSLAVEIRRTLRTLAGSRTFTRVAVLSLAVGNGANVAIFGAVCALMFDTLPVPRGNKPSSDNTNVAAIVVFQQRLPAGWASSVERRSRTAGLAPVDAVLRIRR